MIFKGYTEFKMPRNYITNNTYPELSVEAIDYGNITQEKKRYLLKKYRYVLK